MWRAGTDAWALRGRLGAVAATLLDGETASRRAKNGSSTRHREQDGEMAVAGLRSSSARFWRAAGRRR
jgi:hypothetical protein